MRSYSRAMRAIALSLGVLASSMQLAAAAISHNRTLAFDGQNDVVTAPSTAQVSPTAHVTVEAWVRVRSIAINTSQDRILSKGSNYELTLSSGDTGCAAGTQGHVQWRATIGGIDARICGGQISNDTWHHVAGTYDGVTFALYVDGARVASMSRSGSLASNSAPLTLGNRPALDRPFDGELDEVRIWRRALTQSQLQTGSESTLNGTEADLVAYYRLDETSGQAIIDTTVGANHGVLGTSSASESSDPVRLQASVNTAPVVNAGPDQLVYVPANSVQLYGSAQDDGLPSSTLTSRWTRVSGPAEVTFQNASALQTAVTLPSAGTYVLRLDVSDGMLSASDVVEVRLATRQSISSLTVHPRFVTLGASAVQQFWVSALDGAGNSVEVTPTWSASGGSISPQGQYTAPAQMGSYTVTASASGVSAIATVEVKSGTTWPTNGWSSVTPAAMGMDAALLTQARDYALTGAGAGMITRGGRLVMSWGNTATRYDLKSTTKSIGATALGLAMQDNLASLGDAAQTHLSSFGIPPASNANTGWLDDIALLHLSTQTAGFDKSGGYTSLLFAPGTQWSYTDGGANWLADVLTNSFRTDLNALLFARVFTRLGITTTDLTWRSNAYREDTLNGVKRREFGSGIFANANAMARIGYLYLRRGVWEGQRVIPDRFVEQVQQPVAGLSGVPIRDPANFPQASSHYGLLWWNNADSTLPNVPRDAHWAWGLGDSLIVVIPSLDIVASRAGNGWRSGWNADYSYLDGFITPIVRSVIAKISVPNVVGQARSTAIDAIGRAGLAVSSIEQQTSSTVSPGTVLQQSPTAGASVARNTGVRLVVARAAATVTTPNVVGYTQAAAQSAITQAGLTVGTITQQASSTVPAGQVLSQSPAGGASAASGSQVHLWVSSGAASQEAHLNFDGVNDAVTIANGAALSPSTQISVEAWIAPRTIAATNSQDRLVSKAGSYELTISTGDTGCSFGTQGAVQWRMVIGGVDARICGGQLAPNAWHYVVATYNGSAARLYVDGILVASANRSGSIATNSVALVFGNRSTLDRAFDGELDDIRIWRRALSDVEVRNYQQQAPSNTAADLLAWFKFNEGSGQRTVDASASAIAAVLGTTANAESSDPAWDY